jgi:DNA polymerase/3'-5' exonuclease PolX
MAEIKSNEKVIAHLARLGHLYFLTHDPRRADAFMRAMDSIRQLDSDIAEIAPELLTKHRKIQSVGESTIGEILDVLQTGTSPRLERLEAEVNQQPQTSENQRTFVTDTGRIVWGDET